MQPDVNVPTNWAEFLKIADNKTELFQYLGQQTVSIAENNKVVISTINDLSVSSSPDIDLSEISPCNHEEADTRLLLHCYDASKQDIRQVMIQTVDTDVVVLTLSMFKKMQLETRWIAFSSGKNFRYIPIHEIVESIGDENISVLHSFHAFTSCYQTSAFYDRGKVTAFKT